MVEPVDEVSIFVLAVVEPVDEVGKVGGDDFAAEVVLEDIQVGTKLDVEDDKKGNEEDEEEVEDEEDDEGEGDNEK